MEAVEKIASSVGSAPACRALGVARATLYRHRRPRSVKVGRSAVKPPRSLSATEREKVLGKLHSDRFVDKAPAEVHATLLDEGTYLCSERTMYRILASCGEVRERRNQLRHPVYKKPELLATGPNEVWSWDISKLRGPVKWNYYLYVILDIFSRYVTGWMLASRESTALAKRLIEQACDNQNIQPEQLIVHSDRGTSMTSKGVGQLLADLGITKSLSRPQTSNDNPFSEAQFKTLKYRPAFPARFGSQEDARDFCRRFFDWYNTEHRHSGVAMMTPETVHYLRARPVTEARRRVLQEAYARHPERFVRKVPEPPRLPEAVWINPPATSLQDREDIH